MLTFQFLVSPDIKHSSCTAQLHTSESVSLSVERGPSQYMRIVHGAANFYANATYISLSSLRCHYFIKDCLSNFDVLTLSGSPSSREIHGRSQRRSHRLLPSGVGGLKTFPNDLKVLSGNRPFVYSRALLVVSISHHSIFVCSS